MMLSLMSKAQPELPVDRYPCLPYPLVGPGLIYPMEQPPSLSLSSPKCTKEGEPWSLMNGRCMERNMSATVLWWV